MFSSRSLESFSVIFLVALGLLVSAASFVLFCLRCLASFLLIFLLKLGLLVSASVTFGVDWCGNHASILVRAHRLTPRLNFSNDE